MKNICCVFLALVMACLVSKTFGQHRTELEPGYYIVVSAYSPSRENVAQNYTDVLNRRGFTAGYGFNSTRNYFYVYLKYFTVLKEALQDMQHTRKQSEFAQAWVRVIPGDLTAARAKKASRTVTESAKTVSQSNQKEQTVAEKATSQASSESNIERPIVTPPSSTKDSTMVTDNPEIIQYKKMTLGNTEVFLSLFNSTNNRIVDGAVKVVDTDRSKLLKEVKGNEYLVLPDPKNTSGQLTLICEAFGYRKIQQEINYPLPLADTIKDHIDLMGTTFVINFDLVRYHRGDIATLYNVYFFNDAALMLPESKYQLNALLQMMQENPKYRIRLHGHTNGNYHGRIITMGEKKNFFSLEGSKNSVGSAKDLSYNRAAIIKEYLQTNSIEPSRVEIKAWGGRRPLYDRHSANAKRNVRVEVEILSD